MDSDNSLITGFLGGRVLFSDVIMAKKYNWFITFKKFGIVLVEIFLAGYIAYAVDQPALLGLVPIAEAVRNFIKHY